MAMISKEIPEIMLQKRMGLFLEIFIIKSPFIIPINNFYGYIMTV
jgi:hypothetical protein